MAQILTSKKVDQITNGMTRNEVVKIIGIKPSRETTTIVGGKKSTTLTWTFASLIFGKTTVKALLVKFDENNRAVYWSKSSRK